MKGKNIILGITGGIAAYKAAILVRMLVKNGANVKVLMTQLAKEFITPLTMATLSKNPVLTEFYNPENGDWNSHVDLGLWADAFVVAPATANTMAKMNNGIADNLLLTTYLSARCPVFVAPAMDLDMYAHAVTQENIQKLKSLNVSVIEPGTGELASGLDGKGRMAEPEEIYTVLEHYFSQDKPLKGKKVLITAGPTREQIDPVRFISNFSSGKMGYAIADKAAEMGADVILISGPVNILPQSSTINLVKVESADDMFNAVKEHISMQNIAIFSAAVADYKVENIAQQKIKHKDQRLSIDMVPNVDIAYEVSKMNLDKIFKVGFALETNNELENASEKIAKKGFDMIVLNSLQDKGAGFGHDTNKITIIDKNANQHNYGLKSKSEAASDILNKVVELI